VRDYKVKMTLTDGVKSYEKTMFLSVLAGEESKEKDEDVLSSSSETTKDLFKQPGSDQVTVKINDRLDFVAQDYITSSIGT